MSHVAIEYNYKLYDTIQDLWKHPHCLVRDAKRLSKRLKTCTSTRAIHPDYYVCWGQRFNLLTDLAADPRCEVSVITLRKRMAMMHAGTKLLPEVCAIAKPTGVLEYLVSEPGRPKPCYPRPGMEFYYMGQVTDMLARREHRKIARNMQQTGLPQDLGKRILCHLWPTDDCNDVSKIVYVTSEDQWLFWRKLGYRLVPGLFLKKHSLHACRYDMMNYEPKTQVSIDTGSFDLLSCWVLKRL